MNIQKYKDAYNRLNLQLDPVAKKYKISKMLLIFDAGLAYIRHGASPRDYMNFHFYKLSNRERAKFLTMRRTHKVEKIFNSAAYQKYFNDKHEFNKSFKEFVNRKWLYTKGKSKEEILGFINDFEKVIIKPIELSSGRGIYTLSKNEFENSEKLFSTLTDNEYLIEEFVQQHASLSEVNPSSVNTVRIYTLIDKSARCHIIFASLRAGGAESEVDNFHSGGVGYPLDIETGIIKKVGVDIEGNEYIFHPSTKKMMLGLNIPNWNNLKDFVFQAASKYPESRYIAWDIALLENGFEMIEGNYMGDPGVLQAFDKIGKRNIFEEMV